MIAKKNLKAMSINVIVALCIGSFLLTAYELDWFLRVENTATDTIIRNFTNESKAGSDKIIYVMTSDRCIREMEKYYNMGHPWRRATYSKLVNYLNYSGAKVIAMDAEFKVGSIYRCEGETDDETFAKTLKENPNVIIGYNFDGKTDKKIIAKVNDAAKKFLGQFEAKVAKDKKEGKSSTVETYLSKLLLSTFRDKESQEYKAKQEEYRKAKKDDLVKELKELLTDMEKNDSPTLHKFAVKLSKPNADESITEFHKVSTPFSLYFKVVSGLGFVVGTNDKDNTYRRTPLLLKFNHNSYFAFSMEAVAKYYGVPRKAELKNGKIYFLDREIPLDEYGFLRIKYYGNNNVYDDYYDIDIIRVYDYMENVYPIYSKLKEAKAEKLPSFKELFKSKESLLKVRKELEDEYPKHENHNNEIENLVYKIPSKDFTRLVTQKTDPKFFKDKIIIYGSTASSLFDLKPTPFNEAESGSHIHASAIDNLLQNDFLTEVRHSFTNIILILGLSLITALLISFLPIIWGIISNVILAVILVLTTIYLYADHNLIIDFVTPFWAVIGNLLVLIGINYLKENQQKKFITGAFGQYLSPKIINIIMEDPSKMELGGQRKEITAFFSDVAGFSTISEKLSPEELVQLLNIYLTDMCDVIANYDGTVDKFEGDAIIAFWGAPLDEERHAIFACHSAIEMQAQLIELRKKWKAENLNPLIYNMKMRIGLNSGAAVVGNMGSKSRMDYTMMGDTVNLAARLEGANKFYSTYTMISESTYLLARDHIEARELDKIRVVGKNEPVTVYELLSKTGDVQGVQADCIERYARGLELYKQQRFADAIKAFETCIGLIPDDGPSATYIGRCKGYIENPPEKDWDGVYTLTSKG